MCTQWHRLQLPDSMPPSFRGSAVRYSYQLEATAKFAPQSWGGTPMSATPSTEFRKQPSLPPPAPETPVQHTTQQNAAGRHSLAPLAGKPSRSAARPTTRQQQRKAPGSVHVKTPVHIWPVVCTAVCASCLHLLWCAPYLQSTKACCDVPPQFTALVSCLYFGQLRRDPA